MTDLDIVTVQLQSPYVFFLLAHRDVIKLLHRCKCCGFRLAKHLPLGHNIQFHKHVAKVIAVFATGHTCAHYINYYSRPTAVETAFGGLSALNRIWFSGCIVGTCILLMYAAAQPATRADSHQAFWLAHHLFGVFWLFLLFHGPVFWMWAIGPLLLYAWRRVNQGRQGVGPRGQGAVLREVTMQEPNVSTEGIASDSY